MVEASEDRAAADARSTAVQFILELGRIPRSHERDPKWPLTGPGSPRAEGTMRYLRRG